MSSIYLPVPVFSGSYAGVSCLSIHMNQLGNAYSDMAEKAQRELLFAGYLYRRATTKEEQEQEVQK